MYTEQDELLGCCEEVQPNSVQGAAQDKDYWIKGVYTCIEPFSYRKESCDDEVLSKSYAHLHVHNCRILICHVFKERNRQKKKAWRNRKGEGLERKEVLKKYFILYSYMYTYCFTCS